jgi:hypothetical protein
MCIVPPLERLASASAVFLGRHGDVTQQAQQRGLSRQCLYRQADAALRDLDPTPHHQQLALLTEQLGQLQACLHTLLDARSHCVQLSPDLQAQFAATAQAEGVSLPVARRLLAVIQGDEKTPSVAGLGRYSRCAALRAAALLEVFDEQARPRVHQAAADEIFFGRKPVLMVVEPESQCWLSGRISPSRDGEQWAKELEQLPNLEHLVRDGALGIGNGLARVNAKRQEEEDGQQQGPVSDQLDHFHTLREGRRALRKTQARAERAWSAAEEADRRQRRQRRRMKAETGYATQAVLAWRRAEQAFHQWENDEAVLLQIREALGPFTPEGELNSRQRAEQIVSGLSEQLSGEQWDKFKRMLARPESYAYLDRLHSKVEALPVSEEVREAVVLCEGVRQKPELVAGEGVKQGVMRGLLLVCGVLIASAAQAGQQAVTALRQTLQNVGRASSCVEGINSVVRMQQSRHRKVSQEMLDLKRLYWNLRKFRTGRRKKTSPYERLGVPLPADLSWWQLLQLTPDQLRSLLSALPTPP